MRALNRHVERVFNPDRKEAALPEERPRCGAGYAGTAPSSWASPSRNAKPPYRGNLAYVCPRSDRREDSRDTPSQSAGAVSFRKRKARLLAGRSANMLTWWNA